MKQAWETLQPILPKGLLKELNEDTMTGLQELRLREGAVPELNYGRNPKYLTRKATREDLAFLINAASRYSPWQAETMAKGYLTASGGHRIGICGEALYHGGKMQGIRNPDSVCIRIARDICGIGTSFAGIKKSILILGQPGSGKTTLLRDIARTVSETDTVAVVDEREELFPLDFNRGKRMDVLRLCPKQIGVEMLLRTMGPQWIAVDEITNEADCEALIKASNCGVKLLATAHASDCSDLRKREVYRKLMETNIFENIVILRMDKSYIWERKEPWG